MNDQKYKLEHQKDDPATREEGWLWRAEQIHTFKAILQSVPMGTCAKVICSRVHAALLDKNTKKSFDQVRDKYYRVVKSLVDYLGKGMPPKPYKQAAIQALMLQHWDRIAYPCKSKRGRQQQVRVAGSIPGTQAQQLQAAASNPESATLASQAAVLCHSACAPAAVRARGCGGIVTGSATVLQQQGPAASAQQQGLASQQPLAPLLTTHSSSGLPACSILEPQTPTETLPQLSRAFTAEGPNCYLASPQQPGVDAPIGAQAYAAQSVARQGAQIVVSQLGTGKQHGGSSANAEKQGPSTVGRAPKLALRVVPKDTGTAEEIEAQGKLAYFELSCRGHKTMAALVAALEAQWGEPHKRSGQRMLLWSTLSAVPLLCWGPLSSPEVTVGDIHRTLGQPEPFSLSYTLKAPANPGPVSLVLSVPIAAQAEMHSQGALPQGPCSRMALDKSGGLIDKNPASAQTDSKQVSTTGVNGKLLQQLKAAPSPEASALATGFASHEDVSAMIVSKQSMQRMEPTHLPRLQSPSVVDHVGCKAGLPAEALHAQPPPDGHISYGGGPESCKAGTQESSAHGQLSIEKKMEPQAGAVDVPTEQAAAVTEAGTGAAQDEPSLLRLDLFRPGTTCSRFGTCPGLFRQGATCTGFETSFSGLFGHKQAPEEDKAANSSAKSQPGIPAAPGKVGQSGNESAQQEGSFDRSHACMGDSAGNHSNSQGSRQAEATGSQKEPLSFTGAFSRICKRKQPSCLSKNPRGADGTTAGDVILQQPDEGSKQPCKRSSKRKQKRAAENSSLPGATGRRQGKLPGAIFSEHTLAGLADGVPSHPSTASQLPVMAAGDLPDDLPAEPVVFWPRGLQHASSDPGQMVQASEGPTPLEDFQPSQLGSLLGNGDSWDAAPKNGSAGAGAAFCTERPFAELFAQEII